MSFHELQAFGEAAEAFRFPLIDIGGVILPGDYAIEYFQPGEDYYLEQGKGPQTRSEARSESGSRQRSPAETASGATARTIECGLIDRELAELERYHPDARIISSSPSFVVTSLPVRLFRSLPFQAQLILEVPIGRRRIRPPLPGFSFENNGEFGNRVRVQAVPDVRAWAFWTNESPIRSHHQFPDGSICAYMPNQGLLGFRHLYEIVGMCITWIGKCVFDTVYDRWPGPQHYGPLAMRRRDRSDEYCGCGRSKRYADCCREWVRSAPIRDLLLAEAFGHMTYARELRWQSRPHYPWSSMVAGGLRLSDA